MLLARIQHHLWVLAGGLELWNEHLAVDLNSYQLSANSYQPCMGGMYPFVGIQIPIS